MSLHVCVVSDATDLAMAHPPLEDQVATARRPSRLAVRVCHFPPGSSKWNKIGHRLFGLISRNWRGKRFETLEVIITLIGTTTTRTGLKVYAQLDHRTLIPT